jgi:pyruvate/2-oxoglutarate dehydrogenase complex dihydrolipoamide dehydrogenase (E3) component
VADQVKQAKKILIIGAGATGVELAGEIAHAYPKKEIVITSSSTEFGVGVSVKAQQQTKELFASKFPNVKILYSTKLSEPLPAEHSDAFVFHTVGLKPCTEYLQNGPLQNTLNDNGYVKVKGHTHARASTCAPRAWHDR